MRELIEKLKYRTDHIEELWEEARFKAKDAEKDRPWHRYVYLYVSDYVNKLEDEVYEIKDAMRDEFLKNGTVIAGELMSHCIIVLKDKHFHYITAYEGAQYGYLSDVKEISELAYNELIK
jgi:hypothetical protein